MLKAAIWGAVVALAGSLFYWRRERELDAWGNPCLRFCGPRFGAPLIGLFFLSLGLKNLSDPFYQRHPENSYVEFGFALFGLVAGAIFIMHRVSIRQGVLEHQRWPLPSKRYQLKDLEGIEEGEKGVALLFSGGHVFKINPLLSGQKAFVESVRALTSGSSRPASLRSVGG